MAYLGCRQAAEYIGVSPDTMAGWRWQKRGPAFTRAAGRKVLYSTDDLDAFMAAYRVETRDSDFAEVLAELLADRRTPAEQAAATN